MLPSLLPTRLWRLLLRGSLMALLTALALLLAARALCLSQSEAPLPSSTARQEAALAASLKQSVETLCAHPRYGDAATRQKSIDYITARLTAAGWQVRRQSFSAPIDPEAEAESPNPPASASENPEHWEEHWNIIATAPGTPPAPAAGRYIIGAHYDACDTGEGNPGADDNASSCAALLALADLLSPHNSQPSSGKAPALELVFYACEEPPWFDTEWMGSAIHAAECPPASILGMICLEMLGYYSDSPCAHPELLPGHQLLLPARGDFIAIVGDMAALPLARRAQEHLQHGMPALRVNLPFAQQTELFFSDHRNYAARGIPSIMVTDTALLRNPHYHEATDTPATLNYTRMARVTLNLARFLRSLPRE